MFKLRPIQRLALAVVLLTLGGALSAHAAGTLEQRRACRADAFRLCRDAIPNVSRVTACMEKNIKRLSPPCRAQFR